MARSKKDAAATEAGGDGIIGDTVVDTADTPAVEVAAAVESKSADEGIADLKKRLEASTADNARLERERNEAIQRAYRANSEKEDTDLRLIEGAKAQVVEQNKLLKRDYAAALAAQDFDRAADLQEAMALNQAKALQLENGAQSLKERSKEAPRPLDPVEAMASQLSPKSAAWVRAHPEFASDARKTQKMIAAHNIAIADGYAVDTPAYFESVEDTLKVNKRAPTRAEQDDDDQDGGEQFSEGARAGGGRQVAPAAIPVSREVAPSGQRQRTVRLTPAEIETAELSGMTPVQYYEAKQAIRAERGERLN